MKTVYFDSGTSNTRAYLLDDAVIVDRSKRNVGSMHVSMNGNNDILLRNLKEMYDDLRDRNHIAQTEPISIFASGMVTCPYGIFEVPHLTTPVSATQLGNCTYAYREDRYFKQTLNLIRGVKTVKDGMLLNVDNIQAVNNMRGEEIETFGILSCYGEACFKERLAIILPGSHTHIVYVAAGEIVDLLSTFSGELFHALTKETILADSIDLESDQIDERLLLEGVKNLRVYGLNRALYLAHAMKIFAVSDKVGRKSYLTGVIFSGIIDAFIDQLNRRWTTVDRIVIAGNRYITNIYAKLVAARITKIPTETFVASEHEELAVLGFIELLKKRGELIG
jgi:2-dehydro-3-deoxygalactonokinase